MREAAELGCQGFDYIVSLLKENVQESDLALALEFYWRKKGAQGVAFDPIIAFGENSALPHYRAQEVRLKNNQIVLMDIGVRYRHYHSDMTRVVFKGEVEDELLKIRDIVEEASMRALSILKPGVSIAEVDLAARSYIESKGYGPYFTHSLGHGVGLQIHEFPFLRKSSPHNLQEGMVITIEPGIYLPKLGGVRLEDTVSITATGFENFTTRPRQIHA